MSMVTLIVYLAGGFAIAGLYLLMRTIARRRRTKRELQRVARRLERRRLAGLGTVDAHRERYR